jgi:K+-dependent Na+/Ca+ exchanger-like protein
LINKLFNSLFKGKAVKYKQMALFIALSVLLLCFFLLAVLTEEFFVPSIDILAKKLKLSSDASGATLLAMGSSAPEFFTSLVAVLGLAGAGFEDIGAGAIVGSSIFNILVIVGLAAMYKAVKLQWKVVLRDISFYFITILLLLAVFWDGRVVIAEAFVFLAAFMVYVFSVVKWKGWFDLKDTPIREIPGPPQNIVHVFTHRLMGMLIPDPENRPKYFLVTFFLCILSIGGLSWILVEQIIVMSHVLSINPTFLALTILAAGTSVPDLIGSIVVAKQGRGDMAVSNAIGSNVFDILFGLGFPWMIALAWRGGTIPVSTENLIASVFLLLATTVATLFILIVRNWKIGHKSGWVLISIYIAYCAYIAYSVF